MMQYFFRTYQVPLVRPDTPGIICIRSLLIRTAKPVQITFMDLDHPYLVQVYTYASLKRVLIICACFRS